VSRLVSITIAGHLYSGLRHAIFSRLQYPTDTSDATLLTNSFHFGRKDMSGKQALVGWYE